MAWPEIANKPISNAPAIPLDNWILRIFIYRSLHAVALTISNWATAERYNLSVSNGLSIHRPASWRSATGSDKGLGITPDSAKELAITGPRNCIKANAKRLRLFRVRRFS